MQGVDILQHGQEESSILEDVHSIFQDHVQTLETILLLLSHKPLILSALCDNARI